MKEWRSISKAIKLKKGERGEAVDSHSLSRLKNEELGVSIFIGTGVDDPLVSLNLVGGPLKYDTGTCASLFVCSSTRDAWSSTSNVAFAST